MKIFVTGGAGFIGSAVIRKLIGSTDDTVINIDKLTYAGNLDSLASVSQNSRYHFEQVDICDQERVSQLFLKYQPDAVLHLAAESHVDRSIDGPEAFIQTNIVGTYRLLDCAKKYWKDLPPEKQKSFRFHHVSTDEVFGSLGEKGFFTENSPYMPNSPYSASKASSDHLVRSWHETYHFPVLLTNCSNNFGPFHFPEKLIPLVILNALELKTLPVYGKGENIRDWLFVEDHADALILVMKKAAIGKSYNIGGHNEKSNLKVVESICDLVDELAPLNADQRKKIKSRRDLIQFVSDRPGHDFRYAIDASKIERDLGWKPKETFETGLRKTVQWYLDNQNWCQKSRATYAGQRLGK